MTQAARVLLCLAVLLAAVPATASATTYTVDSTGDLPDAQFGDNICKDTTDPPANAKCTLRAAIQEANARPGTDTIVLPGGRFRLSSTPLGQSQPIAEDITDSVVITGLNAQASIIDLGSASSRVWDFTKTPRSTSSESL